MQISRNIVNGPTSNNQVLVWIWVIVYVQKPSRRFLQTFGPLRMFKIVFRDSSLSKTIVFILSAEADQRKRWPHWLHYQFLQHDKTVTRAQKQQFLT